MTQLSFLDDELPQPMLWRGARSHGLARVDTFVQRAGRAYASRRNYDFGPEQRSNISCLSPWISHRLILEEEVLRTTLARHSLSSAEKFIQEVFWRSYFKGWLEHRPQVWTDYCRQLAELVGTLDHSVQLNDRYQAAVSGQTGIDCFDAWIRELLQTGYLHNHARMWFASIWIFTLGLPWQLGADFFYRHLLDGDAASNTLSWRWVGGLHTKGKTYLARKDNIAKYTGDRFAPTGLALQAAPLVEDAAYSLEAMPHVALMEEVGPYGLLITQEDCTVETLPLAGAPSGVLCLPPVQRSSVLPTSDLVHSFTRDALTDAASRAAAHFECDVQQAETRLSGDALVKFAQAHNAKTLVTGYLPVGPMRDDMAKAKITLDKAGIGLVQVMRPYDRACWPYATKGFFKLKAKIPSVLDELGLA